MNSSKMQYKTCDYHPLIQSTVDFVNYFLTIYWCKIKNLPFLSPQTAAKKPRRINLRGFGIAQNYAFFKLPAEVLPFSVTKS